jgi:hypothetical protein
LLPSSLRKNGIRFQEIARRRTVALILLLLGAGIWLVVHGLRS